MSFVVSQSSRQTGHKSYFNHAANQDQYQSHLQLEQLVESAQSWDELMSTESNYKKTQEKQSSDFAAEVAFTCSESSIQTENISCDDNGSLPSLFQTKLNILLPTKEAIKLSEITPSFDKSDLRAVRQEKENSRQKCSLKLDIQQIEQDDSKLWQSFQTCATEQSDVEKFYVQQIIEMQRDRGLKNGAHRASQNSYMSSSTNSMKKIKVQPHVQQAYDEFYNKQVDWNTYVKSKSNKQKNEMEANAESKLKLECSFKPSIKQIQKQRLEPVEQRTLDWLRDKEIKLKDLQKEKENLEQKSCSFKPYLVSQHHKNQSIPNQVWLLQDNSEFTTSYLEPTINEIINEHKIENEDAEVVFQNFLKRQSQWQAKHELNLKLLDGHQNFKPTINQVSRLIHEKKLASAIQSGKPENYYESCLTVPQGTDSCAKIFELRQAFVRLYGTDPESESPNTQK